MLLHKLCACTASRAIAAIAHRLLHTISSCSGGWSRTAMWALTTGEAPAMRRVKVGEGRCSVVYKRNMNQPVRNRAANDRVDLLSE